MSTNNATTTNQQATTWEEAAALLQAGKVGIIPTDTVYGLVGSARVPEVVERMYTIKQRQDNKPYIVLIPSLDSLQEFGIPATEKIRKLFVHTTESPASSILPCPEETFTYIHRGKKSIAFRIPQHTSLQKLLQEVGPLVAPSANPHGLPIAKTIAEARNYFGDTVDFYIDGSTLDTPPSRLLRLHEDGSTEVLR